MPELDDGGGAGQLSVDQPGMTRASAVLEDYSRRPADALDPVLAATLGAPAVGDGIDGAASAMTSALKTVLGEVTAEFLLLATRVDESASIYERADTSTAQTLNPGGRLACFAQ